MDVVSLFSHNFILTYGGRKLCKKSYWVLSSVNIYVSNFVIPVSMKKKFSDLTWFGKIKYKAAGNSDTYKIVIF